MACFNLSAAAVLVILSAPQRVKTNNRPMLPSPVVMMETAAEHKTKTNCWHGMIIEKWMLNMGAQDFILGSPCMQIYSHSQFGTFWQIKLHRPVCIVLIKLFWTELPWRSVTCSRLDYVSISFDELACLFFKNYFFYYILAPTRCFKQRGVS